MREMKIPDGSQCECVGHCAGCDCGDHCNRMAVALAFDGPMDNTGTALCRKCFAVVEGQLRGIDE